MHIAISSFISNCFKNRDAFLEDLKYRKRIDLKNSQTENSNLNILLLMPGLFIYLLIIYLLAYKGFGV